MQQVFPLAVLAMAPLAQARFGRFQARADGCPPCPASCEAVTVTVSHPAQSQATVTVEKIIHAEPSTVYITHCAPPVADQQIVTTITVEPTPAQAEQSGPKTVTVIQSIAQQQEQTLQVVTRTVQLSTSEQQEPKTVTVTQGQPSEPPSEAPSVVTVTLQPEPMPAKQTPQESPSRPNEAPSVVTKTVIQQIKQSMPPLAPSVKPLPETAVTAAPCPPVNTTTSIATAYNTIMVAVGTGTPGHNATSVMGVAQPSGASNMMRMGRIPRAPIVRRKW